MQASWNFERLQNLGFLYVLGPGLRRLYRGESLKAAYQRHLSYFNTHPFLASAVTGATLNLEEKKSLGEQPPTEVVEFKKMVMAPYAAMGDAFFWGGLRPLAAVIALFLAARNSMWAPIVFLVLFNLPHLWFRVAGLFRGYNQGLQSVEWIQWWHLPDLGIRLKEGTVVLLGGLCAYQAFQGCRMQGTSEGWGFSVLPAIILFAWLARKGFSTLLILMISAGFWVLLAWSQQLWRV